MVFSQVYRKRLQLSYVLHRFTAPLLHKTGFQSTRVYREDMKSYLKVKRSSCTRLPLLRMLTSTAYAPLYHSAHCFRRGPHISVLQLIVQGLVVVFFS